MRRIVEMPVYDVTPEEGLNAVICGSNPRNASICMPLLTLVPLTLPITYSLLPGSLAGPHRGLPSGLSSAHWHARVVLLRSWGISLGQRQRQSARICEECLYCLSWVLIVLIT